uniref:Secreted protein n=2 Tax=Picea TaxID=3328 RepID=A0A101M3Q7_PICGL|nr:hypothetical protein ABT39_MTgene344 [Picea glauca]QHR90152.1 hypothetical protein Q903MT_gene4175 [Picea sitchensis]
MKAMTSYVLLCVWRMILFKCWLNVCKIVIASIRGRNSCSVSIGKVYFCREGYGLSVGSVCKAGSYLTPLPSYLFQAPSPCRSSGSSTLSSKVNPMLLANILSCRSMVS